MFGFLIKKAFFDTWDNFIPAILVNLGFIAVLAIPMLLPQALAGVSPIFGVIAFALGVLALFIYAGGAMGVAKTIVNYQAPEWQTFTGALVAYLPVTITLGVLVALHAALLLVAVPVYSAMDNVAGLVAIAVLFWLSVIWWLSIQYVIPVRTRLADQIVPVFKKAFILSLDNTVFTAALAAGALVITGISFFTAFLIPGITGLAVWYQAALKLRIYKYDYLEENPGTSRKRVPWDALLYEERDRVGKRTLRGMIFPWKE